MSAQLKTVRRPKKCRQCRELFTPYHTTQVVCGYVCRQAYDRAQQFKAIRREQREGRERLKSLSTVCKESQPSVNSFVRARDFGLPCIACQVAPISDAGHLFPIGSKYRVNRLRFYTPAIHGCCAKCNRFVGGGNVIAFREGIVLRYGQWYLDMLDEYKRKADRGELEPLTKDEARQIAADHRRMTRELQRKVA